MSIPPLVCSTPPPPEQCEDDKDHEDFDLTYNLSQEDDDSNEYNYDNFSSYNIYQATSKNVEKEKWNTNLTIVSESNSEQKRESDEILNGVNFTTSNESVKESIPKFEESAIEDLNLIVNTDIVHSNEVVTKEFETEASVEIECSDKQTRIQDLGGTNIHKQDENKDLSVSTLINKLSIPDENEFLGDKNESILVNNDEGAANDVHEISLATDLPEPTTVDTEEITLPNEVTNVLTEISVGQGAVIQDKDESPAVDDFGDFEDFQLTSTSENCQVLSVNSENPWESPEENEGPEFGDFTANFDFKESKPVESMADEICKVGEIKTSASLEDGNEDFGDFDDFRSSDNTETVADTNEVMSMPDVTLWNLNSPDSDLQIVDGINTVLTSIFANEIPEPDNELLGKLESCLSVTWGHLINIDVRQPYMVNWNNSLGQKTLLKALCIDSRNILFGPKWNYNMPKYAVNLTVAPLQPQKQFTSTGSSSNESAEKVPNKEAGAWVDPFTPDGQESYYSFEHSREDKFGFYKPSGAGGRVDNAVQRGSAAAYYACNTEDKSVPTEIPNRPTDIDVFESDSSTKLGKIYSSTINLQPVRHINLPDTHIFTPTDSETPRSKTIHYESGPSGLIPQPVQEINKSQPENSPQLQESSEKEYWDFQDFKGSNTVVLPTNTITQTTTATVVNSISESAIAKANITYQAQILQPIKIDPVMPTLNWPGPGHVKETFDDFSDFISSTSWNNEKDNHTAISLDTHKDQNVKSPKEEEFATDNMDDEFETFQSAPVSSAMDFNTTIGSQNSLPDNLTLKTVANCDKPKNVDVKVENMNTKKINSVILDNQCPSPSNNITDTQEFSFPQTTSAIQNFSYDILQPTSASSSGLNRHQHKSDQILQPLSLESYSQINWPNPGIDLQDLSRFNPINSLHSLKSEPSTGGNSKIASPAHNSVNAVSNPTSDDDIWGDFVSNAPKQLHPTPKKTTFADDDEWTDFVSSPSMKPQNGLNTISFNVHTNLSMQKSAGQNKFVPRNNQIPLDIPTLNYITPKSSNRETYSEKHFQNL